MTQERATDQAPKGFELRRTLRGHRNTVNMIAWSPDGHTLAAPSGDRIIQLWDVARGEQSWTLRGHFRNIHSVAWSPDGQTLASGSGDETIRLWDAATGELARTIADHSGGIWSVAWSPDGYTLAASAWDHTIRLWDAKTGKLRQTLEGHTALCRIVTWSPDGRWVASGSDDSSVRLWDMETGEVYQTLKGHSRSIYSVAWSPDGQILASGSGSKDHTVRLWDPETGQPTNILEGPTDTVGCVSFSADGRLLAAKSWDGTIRVWRCDSWEVVAVFEEPGFGSDLAFHPKAPSLATLCEEARTIRIWDLDVDHLLGSSSSVESVRYRNAKIVLVGDQGVGKSGLGMVLAGEKFKPTKSTHGRHVWSLGTQQRLSQDSLAETHETLLWDLAGQAEFRLVHQLSLDQTSVALVLFDGSSPTDPFKGVGFWNKALQQAKGSEHLVKYLVAARTDVSPLTVTDERMRTYAQELGFAGAFRSSALTGKGVKELLKQVEKTIDWKQLPLTVSERLFKRMKDFIVEKKQKGIVLKTSATLMRQFQKTHPEAQFREEEFQAALERVEAHDLVKILSFGDYVLLQSEMLDNYASAMVRVAREQPDGLGFLDERVAREGWFDFGSLQRVKKPEERVILQAVVELFVEKELAVVDESRLVFPSQFNRELPEHPEAEGTTVSYQFEGALLNAYATLVVRLYHSEAFGAESLWKNAALFLPYGLKGKENRCGFILNELEEGTGVLTVFFGVAVPDAIKILFLKYVHEHLRRKALNGRVKRERIYRCLRCQREVKDREAVQFRLGKGLSSIPCLYCSLEIPLGDLIEETFGKDDEFLAQVRRMDHQIDASLASDSKEMILLGEVMTLVGKAGQIFRPTTMHDWGIDGEIEFKDEDGQASGERLYLQLKSGASYLKTRKDGVRTFRIPKPRHIEYWQAHQYPVYLVIRDADEKIYWMNIGERLAQRSDKAAQTVVFDGEELSLRTLKIVREARLAATLKARKLKPRQSDA